jgi:hypothetical protein
MMMIAQYAEKKTSSTRISVLEIVRLFKRARVCVCVCVCVF